MKDNYNHKIRKVVVYVPEDERADDMRPFDVRGWRSAPRDLLREGGWNNWYYSHDSGKSPLSSGYGWKVEIPASADVNRIEIKKYDGKPVRLAEVQVYTKEVLTSSTLPSREAYQAAILTAMRNRVNEVTGDIEACYNQECG